MSRIWINIVTENQNALEKAEKLASTLAEDFGFKKDVKIEKYTKFPNSYKIELEKDAGDLEDLNVQCLQITSQIAQPWTTYFDNDRTEIELIFNKSARSRFGKQNYNVIKWANAGIIRM